jgi:hypothetical protein
MTAQSNTNASGASCSMVASGAEAWRPIETAPKADGAKLLLWWGGRVVYGSWLDNSKTARPWAGWRAPSLEAVSGQPTHWMPLPQPPSAGAAVQGDQHE